MRSTRHGAVARMLLQGRGGKNGRVSGVPTIACSRAGGTGTTHACGGAKAHATGGEWCNRGGTCRGRKVFLLDDILVVVRAVGRQASSVSQVCTGWRGAC